MVQRDVPTSAITFVETEHGRQRRKQRGIDKKDLQSAKKYGTRRSTHPRPNGNPASIYEFKEITYIVDETNGEEITCYAHPLTLDRVPVSMKMQLEHGRARRRVRGNLDWWTSNTVMVVDTSGSMKSADVWGTRTRLGSVWVSVALDYLATRLENGHATETDVLSVVTLAEAPEIVIHEEPCTWVLYNRIVDIYSMNIVPARGHGPFLPCLSLAEKLLVRNSNSSCAVALTFLSDGKPSDSAVTRCKTKEQCNEEIVHMIGGIALKFGRRLTFHAIGIGAYDDFEVLQAMVDAALDFNAVASFLLPSMTTSALAEAFSSVATSLTQTQTEMTDAHGLKQRQVRDVNRESRTKADAQISEVNRVDFSLYPINAVKRTKYKEWIEGRKRKSAFEDAALQHASARFVAFSKGPFGEGAERFAYRFYEVGSNGKAIVGKPLVAKESRLVLEKSQAADTEARKRFVRKFCSTQQLARRLAHEFNEKLEKTRRVDPSTPKVSFLDCSVYELEDKKLGKLSVLVEERLDHKKWFKWNANNGYVEGMKSPPAFTADSIRNAFTKLESEDLGMIEEGSEDDSSQNEENPNSNRPSATTIQPLLFTCSEVAQAFSHFTYWKSGRKRLVCDLQGVYDESENVLKFSDPVIHYHNPFRADRRYVHGDTDRGRKGVAMFFETHECSPLCKLVLRGVRRPHPDRQRPRQAS